MPQGMAFSSAKQERQRAALARHGNWLSWRKGDVCFSGVNCEEGERRRCSGCQRGSLSGAWNMEAATGLLCALETVLETVWRGRRDLALEGWGHLGFGLNKRGE